MASLITPSTFHSGVWGNAPLVERQFDQSLAVWLDEQFTSYNAAATTGDYVLTQATTGTAVVATTVPGQLFIDAGATTQHQGVNLQRLKSAFLPAAGKDIWAEFYIALTASTPPVTKAQLFVGLAASDTTIFASGAQTTNNRIGWQIQTTENLAATFTCDKAGTATTKTGPTLVDATYIKLGFRYDGTADTVQQYVNGLATGTAVATANIPKLVIYPSFVVQSDGTDRPNLFLSYRILQKR